MTPQSAPVPVPLAAAATAHHDWTVRARPDIALIAQLMATRLDAPQTRRLRRLDAEEGASAYREAAQAIAMGRRPKPAFWLA